MDQPVGVGFSYEDGGEDIHTRIWDEQEVSNDMVLFLRQWMAENPAYKPLPFYLMGESYAGHYIPNIRCCSAVCLQA